MQPFISQIYWSYLPRRRTFYLQSLTKVLPPCWLSAMDPRNGKKAARIPPSHF
jgi:hypothetical protein